MGKDIVYCWEFQNIGCCGSCHSEWDSDYGEPFEEEITENIILHRCCSAHVELQDAMDLLERKKDGRTKN